MAAELQVEDKPHAKYGGSAIELTMLCPGSAKAKAACPKTTGPAAERGTRIHAWLEKYLLGKYAKDAKKNKLTKRDLEEAQIAAHAGLAIKEVAAEFGFQPNELIVEENLPFLPFKDVAGGTPDVGAYRAFSDLLVVDLKAGRNYVDPEKNYQLLFYAILLWYKMDVVTRGTINNVHCVIVQPDQEPPYHANVRRWSLPAEMLSEYEQLFIGVIERAEQNPDLRIPGDHCEAKYCDARSMCPAYKAWVNDKSMGLLVAALEGKELPPMNEIESIVQILNCKSKLIDLIKQAEETATALLKTDPNAVPGWSLEDKYSNRAWESETLAEKAAKEMGLKVDDYKPRELLSPAKMEALIKAKKKDDEKLPEEERKFSNAALPPVSREYAGVKLVPARKETGLAALVAAEEAAPSAALAPQLDFAALL